jgi:hypothetical protein
MSARKTIKPTRRSLFNSVVREIGQVLIALLLMAILPQRILEIWITKQINKYYQKRFARIVFYKSGRSALAAFFQMALPENKGNVILLPDYICNVVYLAAENADALVIPYSTDELFHPNMAHIEELLKSMPVSVVLFASIFGTQNNRAAILKCVRAAKPDVFVVFDESQNIMTDSPIQLDTRTIVAISFNDKTIPGVMGGALCYPPDSVINFKIPAQNLTSRFFHELHILGMLVKRVMRKLRQYLGLQRTSSYTFTLPKYEFSHALFEPYNTEEAPISKLSLIFAYFGLSRLPHLETQRKKNSVQIRRFFEGRGWLTFLNTEYADIAPFMPVKILRPDVFELIKLKGPYAMSTNKDVSLRPDIFCILNNSDILLKCLDV